MNRYFISSSFCITLFIILQSCSNHETKMIDFENFQITIPKYWEKIRLEGIDSNVGGFVTENNDTIIFDYGSYSNPLEEDIIIFERKFVREIIKENPETDTLHMTIVSDISKVNQEDFKINKEHFEKISGYQAKIVSPKHSGKGITGIHFDSLGNSSLGKIKFTLYTQNLNIKNEKELLKAIRTIKLKK